MPANPTFKKREKERARQERQREKDAKRKQRREDRKNRPEGAGGDDLAAAGLEPGDGLDAPGASAHWASQDSDAGATAEAKPGLDGKDADS